MEGGSAIIQQYEATMKKKAPAPDRQASEVALPMTQEPFFSEPQEPSTQDLDLNLISLFSRRHVSSDTDMQQDYQVRPDQGCRRVKLTGKVESDTRSLNCLVVSRTQLTLVSSMFKC